MRVNILSESIRVRTVEIIDPETGEPTGETKEVLSFTVAYGIDKRSFSYDMPLNKDLIRNDIKALASEILANRQKAEQIRSWIVEHGMMDFDTDDL